MPSEGKHVIQKFIAMTTIVAGMVFLAVGVYAFATPDAASARTWPKAVVTGIALLMIGAVAMAGAGRTR